MGFILHIYIIFGTNLLTGGPAHIAVFLPISVFRRKGISTESKQNETFGSVIFGMNVIQRTWSASQEACEAARRQEGTPTLSGHAPYLLGATGGHRRTSSSYIYLRTPKTSREPPKHNFHCRNLLYLRDPILEPSSAFCRWGNRPRRASTSTSLPLR